MFWGLARSYRIKDIWYLWGLSALECIEQFDSKFTFQVAGLWARIGHWFVVEPYCVAGKIPTCGHARKSTSKLLEDTLSRLPLRSWFDCLIAVVISGLIWRDLKTIDIHAAALLQGTNQTLSFLQAVWCKCREHPDKRRIWNVHQSQHQNSGRLDTKAVEGRAFGLWTRWVHVYNTHTAPLQWSPLMVDPNLGQQRATIAFPSIWCFWTEHRKVLMHFRREKILSVFGMSLSNRDEGLSLRSWRKTRNTRTIN